MITLDRIHENFVEAIKNSGMTQAELCEKLGVSQSCMQQYIDGTAVPSLALVANMCSLLHLDANALFCLNRYGEED